MRSFLLLLFFFGATIVRAQVPVIKITDLDKRLKNGGDTTFVVNIWATWCGPCKEELPYFVKLDSTYRDKKSKLLLVSIDDKKDQKKVIDYLKKKKYSPEAVLLDESNADYWMPFIDKDWQGAIPVTLFWNKEKNYRAFFGRQMKEDELKTEWEKALK